MQKILRVFLVGVTISGLFMTGLVAKASTGFSQTITLATGWNVISTPRLVSSHSFSSPASDYDIYILDPSSTSGWSTMTGLGQTEFTPMYGYFINNHSGTSQTLTLQYQQNVDPSQRLFTRTFSKAGWYSIGAAQPTYLKTKCDISANTGNVGQILQSLTGKFDQVIDFNPSGSSISDAVSSQWASVVPSGINTLNDFRELKGYAVYINTPGAGLSGLQNNNSVSDCTGTSGNLAVSISSNTAPANSTAIGSAFVPFTTINFSANSIPVTVNSIKFTKNGTGSDSDITSLFLFNGNSLIAQTSTVQNSSATFNNNSGLFTVPANSTVAITLKGNLSANATTNSTYGFSISSNADITSSPSGAFGNFPISGNLITAVQASSPSLATLNIATNSIGSTAVAGVQNFVTAQYTLTASSSAVRINAITLTFSGSANPQSSFSNLKLFANGAQAGATISQTTGNSVYFDLSSSPIVIPANNNLQLELRADISSNATGNFAVAIQNNYDVVAIDTTYSTGIIASNSFPTPSNSVSISATATLVASINNGVFSPITTVANAAQVKIASFTLNAPNTDSVGVSALEISTATASVANNFQNLRVMVGNTQVGKIQTTLTNTTPYAFKPSSTINIPAGVSLTVDVYADVLSTADTNLNQSIVSLTGVTGQLTTSGNPTVLSPSSITGQTVKISANGSVTVNQSPITPVSRQLAMSQTAQTFGVIKFAETSGNEGATLTDLTITFTATAGTALGGGTGSLNSLLNFSISATDNTGAVLGSTFTKGSWTTGTDGAGTKTYTVTFNNVNLPIPVGPAKYMNLTVKADINSYANGANSGSTWTVGLASASAVTIRGTSSNATITPTVNFNATSNTTTVVRTTIGVNSVGSITSPISVSVNPTGAPGNNENMAIFAVTASASGDAVLNNITLQQGGTAPTSTAVSYKIYDASQGLSSPIGSGTLTGNSANAINLNLNSASSAGGVTISAGTTKYLVVQANTSNFNTGSSGTTKSYTLSATTWTFNDGTSSVGISGDASTVTGVTTGSSRNY